MISTFLQQHATVACQQISPFTQRDFVADRMFLSHDFVACSMFLSHITSVLSHRVNVP